MVDVAEGERKQHIWEMITIASPQPDGMIPIDNDKLKKLFTTIGFEFLVMHPGDTEQIRDEIDKNNTGVV